MYIESSQQFGFLRRAFEDTIKIQIKKYGIDNIQYISILCESRLFNNANVIPGEFTHTFVGSSFGF